MDASESNSSNNGNATSSDGSNNNVGSGTARNGYICTICFKVFKTGQALGGHQGSHPLERSRRQGTPNILGAVLNHHLPSDDDVQTLAATLAASNKSSMAEQESSIDRRGNRPKSRNGSSSSSSSSSHYCPYNGDQTTKRKKPTKNLLGKWNPTNIVSGEERCNDGTNISDVEVPAVDLELSLKRGENNLDLELKL